MSILSLQTAFSTFKNDGFTMEILTCLRNQRFRPRDVFESVLGLSRAPFGSSWGYLGSSLGPLDRPNRASRFALELSWASFARFLLLTMASRAPKRRPTELQNFLKTIFGSKTLIFQKCKDFLRKTIIFEPWRGSSGAQK